MLKIVSELWSTKTASAPKGLEIVDKNTDPDVRKMDNVIHLKNHYPVAGSRGLFCYNLSNG